MSIRSRQVNLHFAPSHSYAEKAGVYLGRMPETSRARQQSELCPRANSCGIPACSTCGKLASCLCTEVELDVPESDLWHVLRSQTSLAHWPIHSSSRLAAKQRACAVWAHLSKTGCAFMKSHRLAFPVLALANYLRLDPISSRRTLFSLKHQLKIATIQTLVSWANHLRMFCCATKKPLHNSRQNDTLGKGSALALA